MIHCIYGNTSRFNFGIDSSINRLDRLSMGGQEKIGGDKWTVACFLMAGNFLAGNNLEL